MTGKSADSGLRHGIDTACEELGTQIAEDLPTTPSEVQSQLSDFQSGSIVESDTVSEPLVRKAINNSPLAKYLSETCFETTTDDK